MTPLLLAQNALDPAGAYAERIASLWWVFLTVCGVAWVLVVAFLLAGIFRRRRDTNEQALSLAVGTGLALTTAALFALLFFSARTGAALARVKERPRVRVEVTAQQWWWKIEYDDIVPSRRFTTANEIYLPVGRPIELVLQSRDVIHSIWIPNLHGKRDVLPGVKSTFVVQADRAGTYSGQCAEFCGLQHAKMRLSVTALPEAEFRAWAERQRQPAPPPPSAAAARGQQVFLSSGCPLCHTISGTLAHGATGPDLTHIASRTMIAAGSIPNTRGHLAGWITDPQSVKPGSRMPPNLLRGEELQALLAYLETLR